LLVVLLARSGLISPAGLARTAWLLFIGIVWLRLPRLILGIAGFILRLIWIVGHKAPCPNHGALIAPRGY